ncbi:hypothetical protein KAR34_12235 [bacterium]|nr:hypothetical protein [bacterium]
MREINLKLIYVLLITISLFGVKAGWCAWTQDGGALNLDLNEGAGYPVVEMCGTIPYAFWVESGLPGVGAKGFIKCFVEGSWSQVGSYINENVDYSISCPDIAFLYSTPYIAWHEGPNPNLKLVYVKYFNGSSWVQLGSGSINNNPSEVAIYPSITFDNETPYIAWQENSGGINTEKIYVKYYDGNQWVQKGAPLNVNMSWPAYNPDIAIDNHTPYVVWNEYTGAKWHIYVKHFNGSDWEQNGNELNVDVNMNAVYPKISFSENTPYIVWQEYRSSGYQVYVKVKNGSSWDLVGSRCLNMDADNVAIYPRIAVSDTTPYVTWMEIVSGKDKVYVKHYNGSDWEQDGSGELNVGSNSNARYPSVATPGDGVVYVAFQDDEGATNKVYVKHIGNPVDVITSPYNILPNHTILNTTMSMKISGVQFVAPVQVRLIRSSTCEIINGYNVNLVNENLITANFNLTGALAGIYNTEVIRPFYSKALNNSFDILELLEKPIQWDITDMGQMDSSTVGGIFSDIVVADGDNDGLKEIFAVCRNQKIFRFKNNDPIWLKTEVFSSAVVGEYYIDVMVADGNHNGGLDLYSASLNNNVYEYCSVNNWTQENVATVGAAVYSLCTGDGNNDGWVKLYAACANGHVYQYAKSTGSWTVEDCGSVGGEIYDVAVGDGIVMVSLRFILLDQII